MPNKGCQMTMKTTSKTRELQMSYRETGPVEAQRETHGAEDAETEPSLLFTIFTLILATAAELLDLYLP